MTVAAGQIVLADEIQRFITPMWAVASTSGSTAATVETVAATSPSTTYLAGRAYRLVFRGLAINVSGGTTTKMTIGVRDTNVAGTQRMIEYGVLTQTGANVGFTGEHMVANTGGTNITGRVLVLAHIANGTGTVQINAGAAIPRYFACYDAGLAADHPEAVSLV